MIRSVLALVVGYVVLVAALLAGFGWLGGDRPAVSVVLVFAASGLAGAATARAAAVHGRGHAVLFGVLVAAAACAALLFSGEAVEAPLWARLAMVLAPIPAASLGGRATARP